jgi:hypothetical protein
MAFRASGPRKSAGASEVRSVRVAALRRKINGLHGLAFSLDGQFLVSASKDHTVRGWDPMLLERKRLP